MFFRTIEPFIAQVNNNSAATVNRIMTPGNPVPPNALAIVKPALENTYEELNITRADIGTFGAKQSLGCPTKSAGGVSAPATSAMIIALLVALLVLVA